MSEPVNGASERSVWSKAECCGASERSETRKILFKRCLQKGGQNNWTLIGYVVRGLASFCLLFLAVNHSNAGNELGLGVGSVLGLGIRSGIVLGIRLVLNSLV